MIEVLNTFFPACKNLAWKKSVFFIQELVIFLKWNYVLVVMATQDSTLLLPTMYISLRLGVYKCFIHWWQCVVTGIKKNISQMTSMVPVNFEFLRYIKHSKEGDCCVSFRREAGY